MPHTEPPYSGFTTAAVHAGHEKDPRSAHLVPIYASSTYVYDTAEEGMRRFSGEEEGYIYSRWGNPTGAEAAAKITALETFGLDIDASGILHASGMGAISTLLLSQLKPGDKILTHYSLYGGTSELMQSLLPSLGITAIVRDLRSTEGVEALLTADPAIRLLYLETPANPTLQCVDLEALTAMAQRQGRLVACDNTFCTPYLQQPFRYGVDFIMHSTTKFLNGHGSAIGGILIGRDRAAMEGKVTKTHRLLGNNANPFDAFLLINGIKTLELRMERHCANAARVASWLQAHPAVGQVHYPGLTTHPDYEVAARQMRLPGAMLSFELRGGLEAGVRMMNALRLCLRTVSLGTVDTLLCHPASMTHYNVPADDRLRQGISDGLIRMNTGIEGAEDIIADLEQALAASGK